MLRSAVVALALSLSTLFTPGSVSGAEKALGPTPEIEREFLVVLDPGHGGTNDGCRGHAGDLYEKAFTLELAVQLAAEIRRRLPHAEVRLTRGSDETMTLAQRVAFANEAEADLLISLHANASPDATQTGFETYVLDARASSLEAARTARRENDGGLAQPTAADDGAREAAVMLRQLQLTANRSRAAALAHAIQKRQREHFPDRTDRGVKQAPFDVLMGARMPAVLFEAGFLDHAAEGPLLRDETQREAMVDGLAQAIVDYYRISNRLQ